MRSGTSFFNGPLFRKTVLRFWPLWFSYAFVLALALPVRLAGQKAACLSIPRENRRMGCLRSRSKTSRSCSKRRGSKFG